MTCTLLFDRQEDVGWKLGWTVGHLRHAALHLPRERYLLFLRGHAACTGRERLRDRVRCDQIASLPRKMQPNRTHKWIGGGADGFAFSFPITGFTHGGAVSSSSAAGDERAAKAGPGQCQETSAAGQSHGGGESPMGVGAWEGAPGKGGLMWQDDLE
jgi:hypothetical protein